MHENSARTCLLPSRRPLSFMMWASRRGFDSSCFQTISFKRSSYSLNRFGVSTFMRTSAFFVFSTVVINLSCPIPHPQGEILKEWHSCRQMCREREKATSKASPHEWVAGKLQRHGAKLTLVLFLFFFRALQRRFRLMCASAPLCLAQQPMMWAVRVRCSGDLANRSPGSAGASAP